MMRRSTTAAAPPAYANAPQSRPFPLTAAAAAAGVGSYNFGGGGPSALPYGGGAPPWASFPPQQQMQQMQQMQQQQQQATFAASMLPRPMGIDARGVVAGAAPQLGRSGAAGPSSTALFDAYYQFWAVSFPALCTRADA